MWQLHLLLCGHVEERLSRNFSPPGGGGDGGSDQSPEHDENILQLVASQSCGHNVAGANPCPTFNKAMSSERTSLIFAPDMEQLNHSEAAESFSSMCNRSSISNLQIQCRYHIVVVSICQLMRIYMYYSGIISIIHTFIIICQLNVPKNQVVHDTFVNERATDWIF